MPPTVKYFNPYTTLGIVRIARDHADMLSQVLALTTTIKGTPCSMHTLHVSGTIRNSQRRAVEHDRRFIMTIKSEQSSRAQSEAVRLAIEEQQTRLLDESAKRIGNLDV
jgi:ribonuclease P/MRP protein subunit POP5